MIEAPLLVCTASFRPQLKNYHVSGASTRLARKAAPKWSIPDEWKVLLTRRARARAFSSVFNFRAAVCLESDWQVAVWHTLRAEAVRVKEKPEASIFNRASTTSGNSLH